jgi:hypothetical protein
MGPCHWQGMEGGPADGAEKVPQVSVKKKQYTRRPPCIPRPKVEPLDSGSVLARLHLMVHTSLLQAIPLGPTTQRPSPSPAP